MNRFKKELRKHGNKLECDYETMPYNVNGKSVFEAGAIILDGITVDSENCIITSYYNVIVEKQKVNRDFTFTDIPQYDGNPSF